MKTKPGHFRPFSSALADVRTVTAYGMDAQHATLESVLAGVIIIPPTDTAKKLLRLENWDTDPLAFSIIALLREKNLAQGN